MVFTPPRLDSRYEAQTLLAYAALAVAVSATIAAAGKRWVGRLASVASGGVAGLLAISQYNAILGAIIGLGVGLLVACGIFLATLLAFARLAAAIAFGVLCGSAALATQRDLSGGPGAVVLISMSVAVVIAAVVIFRRSRSTALPERKRRWLRRLGRASLLLFVVFGLWVSLSVDTARRVNRLGFQGNVNPFTPELSWLWRGCVKVTWLTVCTDATDADLGELSNFTELEFIGFSHTQVTDASLARLRGLPKLNYLLLDGTEINGEGLKHVATLPALVQLHLDDTRIDDENVGALGKLAVLRTLTLKNTPITDAAMAPVGKLVTLQGLNLGGTKVTDAGLTQLRGLTSLNSLDLSHTQIAGSGLPTLAPMTWLRVLDLGDTPLDDAGLAQLPALPMLMQLRLDGTRITDAGLQCLAKQPLLEVVEIRRTAVTDEGAERFCNAMRRRPSRLGVGVNR
jgi:hypothetical protein